MTKRFLPTMCTVALLATAAHGAPYTPRSGDQVIEQLVRRLDPMQQQLQRMRLELSANPADLANATGIAQRYIAMARSETDPRYLGYAQAALAPWWRMAEPPVPVRLLRATLMQSTHHFAQALADLNAVTRADPANAQAWLTRATVLTVQGDYQGATASCARLSSMATELTSITCIANVASMTGRAAKSEALLEMTVRRSGDAEPGMQVWALTLLAEMAARRGDAATAETRFSRALKMSPRDSYLMGAYADFLLDLRRPQDVIELVKDQTRIDTLLLRYALALQQLPSEDGALPGAREQLRARFSAANQRGDSVHQREQARFELHLQGDAKAALALAEKNWAVQKEPADMRVYLEAALKSGDKAAAAPVLAWIRKNAVEDVAIARLARQLTGGT